MIKAVIFDCFGVFYDDPVVSYVNDPETPRNDANFVHNLDKKLIKNMITKEQFVEGASGKLNISLADAYKKFFEPGKRNIELLELSQELRKNYKVGLLSNVNSEAMEAYFSTEERRDYFDACVLSGDVDLAKPDPKIFELICNKIGVEPKEAVMIDDYPEFCEGAKRVGMKTIQYTSMESLRLELTIIGLLND